MLRGTWYFRERKVHRLSVMFRQRNHLVGPARRAANSKAAVTLGHDAPRNRVEDLVEYFVPNALGSRVLDQRKCIPLTQDGQMPGSEELERSLGHRRHVLGNERRIIVRTGTIGPCNQDHEWLHRFLFYLRDASSPMHG